jgi:hypothetical protein
LVKGAYYLRKSWKCFEQAQLIAESSKTVVDQSTLGLIAFGVGTFQFAVSMVPPAFKWIVEMIGYRGDRELAVQRLTHVYQVMRVVRAAPERLRASHRATAC